MHVIDHRTPSARLSQIQKLEQRLHHGDAMIRQLEAEGRPTERHVAYWLELLQEYEQACQAEAKAA